MDELYNETRYDMSLFTIVKASVTTRQAAEYYGVKVEPNGMACCPFHHDMHPSMKVDARYYCFSCHETGDVIDFVGKLFGLTPYAAASKIAHDFSLHPDTPQAAALPVPAQNNEAYQERQREEKCVSVLIDYECLLKEQRDRYSPNREDETWDQRFADAVNALPQLSDQIDRLYSPDPAERSAVVSELTSDGTLNRIIALLDARRNEEECSDEQAA